MNRMQKVDEITQRQIDVGDLSGAALSIIRDGREIYRACYGKLDIESGLAMRGDAIFRMYSMSKPITAAAALLLAERGAISLDDPVSGYLDGFKAQIVWRDGKAEPVKRECTIRDLLNMTSGLVYPDITDVPGQAMEKLFNAQIDRHLLHEKEMDTVEFANNMGKQPLLFSPGEKWKYGVSADVLGAVIQVASGKSFGAFLRDEIFEPLGMADTGFYVPHEKWDRFATLYQWNENGSPKLTPYTGNNLAIFDLKEKPAFESGGAGIASTLDDYARFAQMLLNRGEYGGKRKLKPETVDFMRSAQLTADQLPSFDWTQYKGFSYGNLMCHLEDSSAIDPTECGAGEVGCYGWDGWAGTHHMTDPKHGLIILYLISRVGYAHMPIQGSLRRAIYEALDI